MIFHVFFCIPFDIHSFTTTWLRGKMICIRFNERKVVLQGSFYYSTLSVCFCTVSDLNGVNVSSNEVDL